MNRRTLKRAQPFFRARIGVVVVVGLLGLAMGGCSSNRPVQPVSFAPMVGHSLTLDSPAQRRLAERMPRYGLPWYAVRNQVRPFVRVGISSPTYKTSATYTYDQIYSSGGRVWDHFSQTTYRRSAHATVH